MKRKWIIIGVSIFLALLLILFVAVILDFKTEDVLEDEIEEVVLQMNRGNDSLVYKLLNRTVCDDDYKTVEKQAKLYLKDLYSNMTGIKEIINDDELVMVLSYDNYVKDGKDFSVTYNYLLSTINKLKKYRNNCKKLMTNEGKYSYIKDKKIDDYYKEYFMDEVLDDDDEYDLSFLDEVIDLVNDEKDVIDFLVSCKDSWNLKDGRIVFNDNDLNRKYQELLAEVTDNLLFDEDDDDSSI